MTGSATRRLQRKAGCEATPDGFCPRGCEGTWHPNGDITVECKPRPDGMIDS